MPRTCPSSLPSRNVLYHSRAQMAAHRRRFATPPDRAEDARALLVPLDGQCTCRMLSASRFPLKLRRSRRRSSSESGARISGQPKKAHIQIVHMATHASRGPAPLTEYSAIPTMERRRSRRRPALGYASPRASGRSHFPCKRSNRLLTTLVAPTLAGGAPPTLTSSSGARSSRGALRPWLGCALRPLLFAASMQPLILRRSHAAQPPTAGARALLRLDNGSLRNIVLQRWTRFTISAKLWNDEISGPAGSNGGDGARAAVWLW